MSQLTELRDSLVDIDTVLAEAVSKRLSFAPFIAQWKRENNLPVEDTDQENIVLQRLMNKSSAATLALWEELMFCMKREQQKTLRADDTHTRIGIQGYEGSFNDIILKKFLDGAFGFPQDWNTEKPIQIIGLGTTANVLRALNNGDIDYGQFAVSNSIWWLVHESLQAMGAAHWSLVQEYEMPIEHCLLIRADTEKEHIQTIRAHDQALRQCHKSCTTRFPEAVLIPGTGTLTDNAAIARALAHGDFDSRTAVIGHKSLATLYGLSVLAENIQDKSDNATRFILCSLS